MDEADKVARERLRPQKERDEQAIAKMIATGLNLSREVATNQVEGRIAALQQQREEIQERLADQKPASIFNDTRSFLENRQLDALNNKNEELGELKKLNKQIEEQRRELRELSRARLG